jgi:hypothetical protein
VGCGGIWWDGMYGMYGSMYGDNSSMAVVWSGISLVNKDKTRQDNAASYSYVTPIAAFEV